MRVIKFRGRRLDNGEWYFGSYVYLPDSQSHHIIPCGSYKPHIDAFCVDQVEVDPETVGQYVGICDSNGVEIYEGDILLYPDQRCGEVHWKKYLCGFHTEDFRTIEKEMTIIGNIYDGTTHAEQTKKGDKR